MKIEINPRKVLTFFAWLTLAVAMFWSGYQRDRQNRLLKEQNGALKEIIQRMIQAQTPQFKPYTPKRNG